MVSHLEIGQGVTADNPIAKRSRSLMAMGPKPQNQVWISFYGQCNRESPRVAAQWNDMSCAVIQTVPEASAISAGMARASLLPATLCFRLGSLTWSMALILVYCLSWWFVFSDGNLFVPIWYSPHLSPAAEIDVFGPVSQLKKPQFGKPVGLPAVYQPMWAE